MAERSSSPQKPLQPPSAGDPIAPPNPQNPSLSSPQIHPSPSMELPQITSPQLPPSQQHQMSPASSLDYSQKQTMQSGQQQQNGMPASVNFQAQPSLQRSGSMPRISQLQQQLGPAAAAGAMRQHTGMYGGQMNFGASQVQQQSQQQQSQQQMAGSLSRSAMISQGGQLPVLPGQTASHLNLQSQMLGQPRQKMNLVQGSQFLQGNSPGQALQGMQTMGMMGSLGMSSQLRANAPISYGQQRFTPGQMRQQQLSQQMPLTSPQKLSGQNLSRASSLAAINPQLSGLVQNGQAQALMQNTLSQQHGWLKQMQPTLSVPGSPSYPLQQQQQQQQPQQQRQQQSFLPQQISSSQLQHQKSMGLSQQQIAQLVQQQQMGTQQQQQQHLLQQQQHQQLQQLQQLQQQQQQQQQQPHQSPRMTGPVVQNSLSLTGSQPGPTGSGTTIQGGSSSHGIETSNQLLGKRKIQDLVLQVDPHGKVDPEVEALLLEIADDFIDSVTTFACSIAKHRKSSTLEPKDLLLHLEKNWHLSIPGFTRDEPQHQRKYLINGIHEKRLEAIQALMESQHPKSETSGKGVVKQFVSDSANNRPIKSSPSTEQLILPVSASQMLHKIQRF